MLRGIIKQIQCRIYRICYATECFCAKDETYIANYKRILKLYLEEITEEKQYKLTIYAEHENVELIETLYNFEICFCTDLRSKSRILFSPADNLLLYTKKQAIILLGNLIFTSQGQIDYRILASELLCLDIVNIFYAECQKFNFVEEKCDEAWNMLDNIKELCDWNQKFVIESLPESDEVVPMDIDLQDATASNFDLPADVSAQK